MPEPQEPGHNPIKFVRDSFLTLFRKLDRLFILHNFSIVLKWSRIQKRVSTQKFNFLTTRVKHVW